MLRELICRIGHHDDSVFTSNPSQIVSFVVDQIGNTGI
jgi:hypothetical protein